MKKKDGILPLPEKIKTPIEELEVLSELENTVFFQVLKRVARRYTEHLKSQSFTLDATDPNFQVKHTRYVEQAVGMNLLIKIIENSPAQLNRAEEQNEKLNSN